jgi:hypothetical protein
MNGGLRQPFGWEVNQPGWPNHCGTLSEAPLKLAQAQGMYVYASILIPRTKNNKKDGLFKFASPCSRHQNDHRIKYDTIHSHNNADIATGKIHFTKPEAGMISVVEDKAPPPVN